MKKITMLVSARARDRFIKGLREAGVLHIQHVREPRGHEASYLEDRIDKLDKAIEALSRYEKKARAANLGGQAKGDHVESADRVLEYAREKGVIAEKISSLKGKLGWFSVWGEIDPADIRSIAGRGVNIKLYRVDKAGLKTLEDEKECHIVGYDGKQALVALITRDQDKTLPFDEIPVPEESPDTLREELALAMSELDANEKVLLDEAAHMGRLREGREKIRQELEFTRVRLGMQEEVGFAYVQGFCPASKIGRIKELASAAGAGYLINDPDDPDVTPTLITNPAWIRIIDPVFKFMNTLPGYGEYDISVYFLLFFSLFFAMLVGDAGYGILFLILTAVARRKLRNAPREPFILMYVLSTATVIWGTITGTWFGSEKLAKLPLLRDMVVPAISSFAGDNQNLMIFICFVIGAIHLTIAHALKAIRVINSPKAVSEIGWIAILWSMFFAAGKFVLGNVFPPYAGWMFIAGIVCVLFFSNTERGIVKGALATLADLPLSVISSFSDVVSYLRLFAVGFATVVVADSFNSMALGGAKGIVGSLMAAMILFMGHALNIILACMAVIVHGIRLNMLEFSGHLGMQWSGRKYDPFGGSGTEL
ncbi:MAG: hypothetical protein PHQ61_07065 [Candidatus Omnitrophica bacterium]|nr:hypothetical protein [Candidatus Omnitrophota bacterium]